MMKKYPKQGVAILVAMAILAGCASSSTRQTTDSYSAAELTVARAIAEDRSSQIDTANNGTSMHIDRPYYGSKSIPLRGDPVLPEVFQMLKRFVFPGRQFSITEAAGKITEVSGIQIRVSQDILKDGGGKGNIVLDSTASTAGILDLVTAADGLSWEFRDGVVYIQKYITRSYRIKAVFGSRKHTFKSGSTGTTSAQSANAGGGGSGTISTGFNSQTTIESNTDTDPVKAIEAAVKTVLTKPAGQVVATGTNTLVVTDTAEGQRRAEVIIERENEILTRNVTYRVQVFSFTADNSDEAGFDLQALYKNVQKYGLSIQSPASITSAAGAAIGIQVLSGATPGRFDGSEAIFKLLSQRGKTVSVHDVNVPTRNLISTPLNLTTEIPYLAKTTPAPAGGAGTSGGTPGLEMGKAVIGFKMDFTSNILDSNTISLQLGVGLVDLLEIRKVSAGEGLGSLESPVTNGFELAPELFLKPYQTTLITGYERNTDKYARSGMGKDWPLILGGGSFNASGKKEKLFILITPTIVGNAY